VISGYFDRCVDDKMFKAVTLLECYRCYLYSFIISLICMCTLPDFIGHPTVDDMTTIIVTVNDI
jgi:hypothetical protein